MSGAEVIALFGPTGVGKTAVALALAGRLRERGEDPVAVSADALQVYAGLERLTGAASPAEREILEHRLIGCVALTETFSAGEYAALAHREIDGLLATGRRPIVVGGTGLYLRAALTELALRPPPAPGVRERWLAELARVGAPALHVRLAARDPAAAARVAVTDARRIVRGLELLDSGGSASDTVAAGAPNQLWTAEVRHPTRLIGLVMDRAALDRRIEDRVDALIDAGAAQEVARALAHPDGVSRTARQALGFEELRVGDVDAMKRRTRQYARRQLTWMRKLAEVTVLDVTDRDPAAVAEEIDGLRGASPAAAEPTR